MKTQSDIFLRDIVYTPKGVRAVFKIGDGRTIEIEPDSLVQFDDVTLDSIDVTLFGGMIRGANVRLKQKFKLKPFKGSKLLAYLPDVEPLELRQSELSQRLRDKLRNRRKRGKINDKQKAILPLNKLEFYLVDLVTPKRHEQEAARTWIDTIWSPIPLNGIVFEVAISKTRDFKQAIIYETKVNEILLQLRDESAYYWQVRASRNGKSVKSKTGRFLVAKGKKLKLFERLPTGDLGGYISEIAKDSQFNRIVNSRVTNQKRCSQKNLRPGKYYCRIRPVKSSQSIRTYWFEVD